MNGCVSAMVVGTIVNGFVTALVAGTVANGLGLWLSAVTTSKPLCEWVGYVVISDDLRSPYWRQLASFKLATVGFLQIGNGWLLSATDGSYR